MSEYSTLSSKGQLVIPKKIRELAGLKYGDELELVWRGDHIEIRKAAPSDSGPEAGLVRELLGKYSVQGTGNASLDEIRSLRDNLYGKVDS